MREGGENGLAAGSVWRFGVRFVAEGTVGPRVYTYENLLIRLVAFSRCGCKVEINVSILGDGRDMEDRPQERLQGNI